jgi:hypothetical protein
MLLEPQGHATTLPVILGAAENVEKLPRSGRARNAPCIDLLLRKKLYFEHASRATVDVA